MKKISVEDLIRMNYLKEILETSNNMVVTRGDIEKMKSPYNMDCIKAHLISRLMSLVSDKRKSLKVENWFYFEDKIDFFSASIDRINKDGLYLKDGLLPIGWSSIKGSTILEVYNHVLNNNFYFYIKSGDRFFKSRVKKC